MKDPISAAYHNFQLLGIERRTARALIKNDVLTVLDLTNLTEVDLMLMPGIGEKSLPMLMKYVRKCDPGIRRRNKPTTISATFPADVFLEIDRWREKYQASTRADAVRRLVELGLARQ